MLNSENSRCIRGTAAQATTTNVATTKADLVAKAATKATKTQATTKAAVAEGPAMVQAPVEQAQHDAGAVVTLVLPNKNCNSAAKVPTKSM